MAKKLTFLSTINPIWWKLIFKSVALALVLFLAFRSGFSFFWAAVFFILALYFYFTSCLDKKIVSYSFWLTQILAVVTLKLLTIHYSLLTSNPLILIPHPSPLTPHLLLTTHYSLLTLVFFALANFLFKNQQFVYNIVNFLLVFWVNALVFSQNYDQSPYLLLILPVAVFLLSKEAFLANKATWSKRITIASAVLGFLSFEMAFFLGFLPLGFLNSALLLTFFYLVLRDILIGHFSGQFHLQLFFEELTIFLAVFLAVLTATKWTI